MRWLLALFILMGSMSAEANRFYGEFQFGVAGVRHSELNFYPSFGSVSAGLFVQKDIGIEIFADAGIAHYSTSDVNLEVKEAAGVALRLQSPATRNVSAFVLIGFVSYLVEQSVGDGQGVQLVQERFEGARVSLGLQQRLVRYPGLLVAAEYRHYNSDTQISVDSLGLSVRVHFK